MTEPRSAHAFCTLFDKDYLLFGLALHRSLMQLATPFHLFVLAMDEPCEKALRVLALEHVVIIPLRDVLTPDYDFVHRQMSPAQICWTCQPLLCRYLLDRCGVGAVTYLEADSFFFSDPRPVFDEIGSHSVSVVPHRYAPGSDSTATSGIYCVQFNLFRDDAPSRDLLDGWERASLTYDRRSPLAFPGQLALNGWPARSPSVWVVQHIGAGVAPWNQARYRVSQRGRVPTVDGVDVVFYHFHGLSFVDDDTVLLSPYALGTNTIDYLYRPYLRSLAAARAQVRHAIPGFAFAKRLETLGVWEAVASLEVTRMRRVAQLLFHRYYRGRRNIMRLP